MKNTVYKKNFIQKIKNRTNYSNIILLITYF